MSNVMFLVSKRLKLISTGLHLPKPWSKSQQSAIHHIDTARLSMIGNQSADRIRVNLQPGDYPNTTLDDLITTLATHIIGLNKVNLVKERYLHWIGLICSASAKEWGFRAYGKLLLCTTGSKLKRFKYQTFQV